MRMSDGSDADSSIDNDSFTPVQVVRRTRFGMVRTCHSLNWKEICFLLGSVASLITTLALSIYTLAVMKDFKHNSDFFFAIVIIVNVVFCLYYAIYGIYWERFFEILVYCIGVVIFVIYLVANFASTAGWSNNVKIGRLVVASLLAPVCLSLGLIIAKDFYNQNSLIVRTVGAASEFASACKRLFTLQAALKLDLQMGVTFLVLLCAQPINTTEIILLSVGGSLVLIWFFLGMLGARYENKLVMLSFFPIGLICGPAYIIYRMYVSAKDIKNKDSFIRYIGIVTMAVACVYLLTRVFVLILGGFVYKHFGRGLKQKLDRNPEQRPTTQYGSGFRRM